MKLSRIVALFIVMAVITACSKQDERNSEEFVPQILDVQVNINPENGEVNKPILIEAALTYGDKKVTDPDEIEFEVWRSQAEKHEIHTPKHFGDGVFRLEKTFSEEGTYYVYVHVTAENMHTMPKKEFIIGQPSELETKSNSESMETTKE
jgi:hypothetical protein